MAEGLGIAGLVTVVGELGIVLLDDRGEVLACGGVARKVGLQADKADGLGNCSEAVARVNLRGGKFARLGFAGDTCAELAVTGDVNGFGASVGKGAARERAGDGVEKRR